MTGPDTDPAEVEITFEVGDIVFRNTDRHTTLFALKVRVVQPETLLVSKSDELPGKSAEDGYLVATEEVNKKDVVKAEN